MSARSASIRPRTWGASATRGMMVTNDTELGRSLARLRVHGMEPKYHHHEVGFNSRLDALQAAVLRVKLRHLDAWTNRRREAAARYQTLFDNLRLTGTISLPRRARGELPRLQPVRHPRSRLDPRRAPRPPLARGRSEPRSTTRSRSTCSRASRRWATSSGDFPSRGSGRPRDHRPADLSGAQRQSNNATSSARFASSSIRTPSMWPRSKPPEPGDCATESMFGPHYALCRKASSLCLLLRRNSRCGCAEV